MLFRSNEQLDEIGQIAQAKNTKRATEWGVKYSINGTRKEKLQWISKQRVVKGIFVTRDRPFFFPVKCEIAIFFLVNRDFDSSREA